ncbi:ZZ-type zinc finger-containing protein 3 isoform X2 [Rhinatrema bivittatum]|uniref:ZZ-type zinc finger-containing protein 3 isoform X2 n=1 Tax=Rhinatrema bivittatum TaxID=194408 RepID=UPI00112BC652|nr:ZZ-type zinc finger-containing protein 3 isoform X2 [Rhinatrema bivittatum]
MLGICHSMAASRSTRVTRSTVGINGLDENFCGRTLRNRSIAHPEDIPPHALLRSRSPKKKPESVQPQKGSNGGKSADLKLQSIRESWVSPRKRGLSASEKDNAERECVENCEKKQTEAASPVLKRSKRLRSEAINSSEEDSPTKTEKEERKSPLLDKDADSPRTKQACRCLLLDDSDKREVKKVNVYEEVLHNSKLDEETSGYQVVNGVVEKDSTALNCDDCEPLGNTKQNSTSVGSSVSKEQIAENGDLFAPSSLLLNSSKEYTVSDHNVPCTNSQEQVKLEDHKLVNDSLPNEHAYQASEPAAVSCAELHSSVRDFEEEVDVVGDSSASKEQCAESTPSHLNPDHDSTAISGELEPSSGLECASVQMASLSELQEHRYTLRTSPRRAACTKGGSYKCNSPCRENGPAEENKLNSSEKNVATSINDSESPMDSEEVDQPKKEASCNSEGCAADSLTKPPSEARLIPGYVPSAKECASLQTTEEEEEDPDVYYFESDHVALKHNKDYQRLLQTIAVLEAQRTQSVQDLESLDRCQRESLKDPIGFVENLQKKVDLGLPCPQRVVQLPEIAWDQYTTSLGNFEREFRNRKHNTRRVKLIFDKGLPVRPKSPLEPKKDNEPQSYSVLPLSDCPESSTSTRTQMIRGRLCDETKPGSFNQLWTVEEQRKLEQLLLKYPPEEVESRRWQKIADELGNRTAKQVASRVQKYFIKLTKAGIPVPGRTPNLYMCSKKSSSKRQHPLNKHLFKPSTFMTSHEPPVYMDEDDDQSAFYSRDMDAAAEGEASDEESIPPAYRELAEYKELLKLKKLKKQKLQQIHMESGFVQHVGFKCDNCGTEPIQGVRWHCQDCPQQKAVDFCDSCSDCLHETETHKEDHQLEPVYRAETFLDRDYCMSQGTSYNYLDPNYFPANR